VSDDRELLVQVHRDVEAALASAKKLWAADAGDETLMRTAEMFMVHLRELRRNGRLPASTDEAPPAAAEVPRSCPVCQGLLRDQRATKRGNQPDFKCRDRNCDGAIWLEPKKKGRTL
jgi:hypothetical protein